MISFNIAPFLGTEFEYINDAIQSKHISGDGQYTKNCSTWLEKRFNAQKVLLTTSCTSALEMAALLIGIQPDDEVILPSYTFSSTATGFSRFGAKMAFVDIRPDTMNIDETMIEAAITDKTKAIIAMHYAGVACEMDVIEDIAKKHGLFVVEDAAQGIMSTYNGRPLGTMGDLGCFSFHETKNYSMGEGGALIINDPAYNEAAEVIREKGTNRSRFFRGQVDKYTWIDNGSSYLPSDLNAAYLWAQLVAADEIAKNRMDSWNTYHREFAELTNKGVFEVPHIPEHCEHNAHIYYIKCKDLAQRTAFIDHLRANSIWATFHYVPLHSSPAGLKFGRFSGEDLYTTKESERLVRLPLYYNLSEDDQQQVIEAVKAFGW